MEGDCSYHSTSTTQSEWRFCHDTFCAMLSKIFPPESGPIIHSARQNIPLIGDSVQTEVVKSQRLSCACETYKNVQCLCIGLDLVTQNVMCVCVHT